MEDTIAGVPVQIMVTGEKTARIERILSTDPQDFLLDTCQPGQEIAYRSSPLVETTRSARGRGLPGN